MGRRDPRPLLPRGAALRRKSDAAAGADALVPAGDSRDAARGAAAVAPLRGRRSGGKDLCKWEARRGASRRVHSVYGGADGISDGWAVGADRRRPRRNGHERILPRQAEDEAQRDLVHAAERHLADRLDGVGAAELYHRAAHHAGRGERLRARRGAGRGKPRVLSPLCGAARRRVHEPRMRSARGGPRALDAGAPETLRVFRRAGQRPRRELFCAARRRRRARRGGAPLPDAERETGLPHGRARSGLLAGRTLHRAERRGPRLGHPDDEKSRLQHAAQAHQGGADAVVLSLRPAGDAGLAGHAERRREV